MIVAALEGGLGNQLFQYAMARRLSIDRGVETVLDLRRMAPSRKYGLGAFCIRARQGSEIELHRFVARTRWARARRQLSRLLGLPGGLWREASFGFNQQVLRARAPAYLMGYWQSEKYFLPVTDHLVKELRPSSPLAPQFDSLRQALASEQSVAVHVRRGDFLDLSRIHPPCPPSYYEAAAREIQSAVGGLCSFFVFSDDPAWAATLRFPGPLHIVSGSVEATDVDELLLMREARHHVLSNSTFGWWGAWLATRAGGVVVAPSPWFGPDGPADEDIVPTRWRRQSVL